MWKRWSAVASRRAGAVLALVAVVVAVLAVLGSSATDGLANGLRSLEDPSSAGARARQLVEDATGAGAQPDLLALVPLADEVGSPAGRARVDALARELAGDPRVAGVATPASPAGEGLVGRDGRAAVLAVTLRTGSDDQRRDALHRLSERLAAEPGVRVSGLGALERTMTDQLDRDLTTAELLAFPLLFLASLWVFRSVVAALLPLAVGGAGLVASLALLGAVNEVVGLSSYVTNLVIMLVLGLAIDYSLFFVNRYREELDRTGDVRAALETTLRTTGRTIVFSALLVSAALGSLLVFPVQFVYSMGVAGVLAPLLAVVAALVVLPPLVVLLGRRIGTSAAPRWRAARREGRLADEGFWYRLARFVMRRPGRIALAASAALLLLGTPALSLRVTGFTPEQLPTATEARQAHDDLVRAAPHLTSARFFVAVESPNATPDQVADYALRLGGVPGVTGVTAPRLIGSGLWRLDVSTSTGDLGEEARRVVAGLRSVPAPGTASVGGLTALFADEIDALRDWLPHSLLVLVVAMVLLLFAFTRSVVLPLKTLVMNAVTLAASIGVLVVVFQWLELGQPPGAWSALEVSTLIVTVTTAFGLATDYGVFVLGRIAEGHRAGLGDERAIAVGMERTGRLVTSAALLFAIAVGAFATSQLVFVRQLAVGLLVAVLIDATVVRAFLVPALMRVLGAANWWAPAWLARPEPASDAGADAGPGHRPSTDHVR
ncbi:MMPL family transporter [Actinosynnema sp. NPDC050436]|uniref:MMPL family transporter n=1 Tax=Actinosynnema sp. NPDC050436 TaxID=3155659 RepID=UPI0033DF5017